MNVIRCDPKPFLQEDGPVDCAGKRCNVNLLASTGVMYTWPNGNTYALALFCSDLCFLEHWHPREGH